MLEAAPGKLAGEDRAALLAIDGAATRGVLGATLRDHGYSRARRNGGRDDGESGCDLRRFRLDRGAGADAPQADARPAIICVAEVGNGKVDRLLADGRADAVLLQPVSSRSVREILAAIDAGTLASLRDAQRRDPHADLPDLGGLSVLVADDSPVNREVVAEALARLNARATMVEDGRQALAAFARERFDVMLMDCSMPEMDGFAATRAIRALRGGGGPAAHAGRGAHRACRGRRRRQLAGRRHGRLPDQALHDARLADCLLRWRGDAPRKRPRFRRNDERHPPASDERPEDPEVHPRRKMSRDRSALDPETLASLRAIAGGSNAMLGKIFGLFQSHAPARLEALKQAVAAADFPRMATEAHALKSPSVNIGALRLGELCAAIEARARAADAALLSDGSLDRVEQEFAAVLKAIEVEQAPHQAAPATEMPSATATS